MTRCSTDIVNVAIHLTERACETPFDPAIYFPAGRDHARRVTYSHLTYAQLERDSNRIGHGLLSMGFQPGTRVVLMVTPSPEFFALTFGLLKSGIIPIMIDPGMGASKLGQCIADAAPEAFIGIPKAVLASKLMGWGRKTVQKNITVTHHRYPFQGTTLNHVIEMGSDTPFFNLQDTNFKDPYKFDDIAAINFTSGSTGIPKGAVYTHGIFAAQIQLILETYGIEPGEIDLCTFPLFALFAPALGMTAVIPDMDFTRPAKVSPEHIKEAMDDFGPTNMFGSTALLNRVGRWCQQNDVRFPTLKRVICAGAPISPEVLRYFTAALNEDTQVYSGYGATEAMPLASIGSHMILQETGAETDRGKGVCVGFSNSGIDLDIIEITDEPIPEWNDSLKVSNGTIGEIVACGNVVTQSYFNRDEATRMAKIHDNETGRKRHRMGDTGWIDEQNRLWFCGRKNHRLETSDGPMFTIPVEGVFNAHPAVFRTAVVGIGQPGNQSPVLCVEREKSGSGETISDHELFAELRKLSARYKHTQSIKQFIIHKSFPVDVRHNSKIFREKLQIWVNKNRNKITYID